MKAIKNLDKLPKFLVCNSLPETWRWNKRLPMPWKKGEIVKVQGIEAQKASHAYDDKLKYVKPYTDKQFRSQFVRIIRKDRNGKFTIKQTGEWRQFELLSSLKK
jgi:hypothetical protein